MKFGPIKSWNWLPNDSINSSILKNFGLDGPYCVTYIIITIIILNGHCSSIVPDLQVVSLNVDGERLRLFLVIVIEDGEVNGSRVGVLREGHATIVEADVVGSGAGAAVPGRDNCNNWNTGKIKNETTIISSVSIFYHSSHSGFNCAWTCQSLWFK